MLLQSVPARRGQHWVGRGVRTFFRQPLAMTGLFFLFMAVVSLLSLLPWVGVLLALAVLPALNVGVMAATQIASEGRFPSPTTLWVALRAGPQRRPMLQLGLLYAVGFVLLVSSSVLVDGGQLARVYLLGEPLRAELVQAESFQIALWLLMLLYLPFAMLFWHAPALVFWHQVPPLKSLFFSWMGCWRNKAAFLVYGALWAAIFGAALLGATLAASLFGAPELMGSIVMPAALLVTAVFFTSMLFTVQDCFSTGPATPPEPITPP